MKHKRNPRVPLTITTLQARIDYMQKIADEGILGSTVAEVADFLIAQGIDRILQRDRLAKSHVYRAESEAE